jgi:plastocyanin
MTPTYIRALVCLSLILLVLRMLACTKASRPQSQAANSPQSQSTPIDSATVASISGTVSFHGVPPQPVKIDMSNDPACKRDNQSEKVVADGGRLANVLVYVKDGLASRTLDPPRKALIVKQQGCRYAAHVAAVMVGQPVDFVDDDQALHNIHPVAKNPEWNRSQMPNSAPIDKTFPNLRS